MDDLIKQHRQHIRDFTEFGKIESKLLVNFTMSMGSLTGSHSSSNNASGEENGKDKSFENYVKELDALMDKKLKSVLEMKEKIQNMFIRN